MENNDVEDEKIELDPSTTVLDLTSFQLHDLDSVEFPPRLTELDLTANRLSHLDSRIAHLSDLKKLSFRQNLIDDAAFEPFSCWDALSGLQELVLRDNKLKKIPDVGIFKSLLVFDVSFNEISSLHGLSKVSATLKELYVSKNEVMENMHNLTNLQELWLGRNRIKSVNLCGLKCIKKLSLQSNRLTSTKGFEECVALEELYLSHNGIEKMEGLSTLSNLRILDVAANKLTSVDDIQTLTRLEDLWLNDNQIQSVEGLAEAVAGSRETLTTIYLENNPCAKSPNYTTDIRQIFPSIQQIDSEVFA